MEIVKVGKLKKHHFFFIDSLKDFEREREITERGGSEGDAASLLSREPMRDWILGLQNHDPSQRPSLHWLGPPGAPRVRFPR